MIFALIFNYFFMFYTKYKTKTKKNKKKIFPKVIRTLPTSSVASPIAACLCVLQQNVLGRIVVSRDLTSSKASMIVSRQSCWFVIKMQFKRASISSMSHWLIIHTWNIVFDNFERFLVLNKCNLRSNNSIYLISNSN